MNLVNDGEVDIVKKQVLKKSNIESNW